MLDLALLNELLHRSCDIFDRHIRINAVLIEKVDNISLQSRQRGFSYLFDVFWPAIQLSPLSVSRRRSESEFGCNHHLPTKGSKGFAHKFFVCERAVNFSGIKK